MEPLIEGAPSHDSFQSVFMIPKHAASLEIGSARVCYLEHLRVRLKRSRRPQDQLGRHAPIRERTQPIASAPSYASAKWASLTTISRHWYIENRCHLLVDVTYYEDHKPGVSSRCAPDVTLLREMAAKLRR